MEFQRYQWNRIHHFHSCSNNDKAKTVSPVQHYRLVVIIIPLGHVVQLGSASRRI